MTLRTPGRGAGFNPPNRFEARSFEPVEIDVPCEDDEPRTLKTIYLRDSSKSILSKNDSPDLGFAYSINPYRGCNHGCSYCLAPDTPILYADMTWRPIGNVKVGDLLVGFDETVEPGLTRKFRRSVVEHVWWSRKPTLRLVTEHAEVFTTAEHRWLQSPSFRWSRTEQLKPGRMLRLLPATPPEPIDDEYRLGYIGGVSLGDGTFRYLPGQRSEKLGFPQAYWRVAMTDHEPLVRLVDYLRVFGVDVVIRPFDGGRSARKPLSKVETRALAKLDRMHRILTVEIDSRNYRRGFLAGFFDAEGSNSDSLRITQLDVSVLERVQNYGLHLGFDFQLEPRWKRASTVRLRGKHAGRVRFFSVCQTAIERKKQALFGREMNIDPEVVRAIEPSPARDVVDIQTSTGTFFAAGLATHNCYARPTHEYLGFSAGLDFESKIVVKENAPELLREELSRKSWVPQLVVMSGNTDCYQPVERTLGITRRCLEVFLEFRNPVGVITKNALVTRDVDVLKELAKRRCAGVTLSVTTLDADLARRMEPRTSTPTRRLEAIRVLADAGIPVRVNVAPVIPGLTDEEIPAILAAAKDAGATGAGTTIVRLSGAVKPIFLEWLEREYPLRAPKVIARLKDIRGDALTDSRFGSRQTGEGEMAAIISALFQKTCEKLGLNQDCYDHLDASGFSRPGEKQGELFG
jgi:DNA repair photolyase